ncbi:MAG: DNA-3-methyladenine glycosylase [Armatimonadota bacterium]|nr:DNA-3-methyladenine glycosylase [Armatimonadota bacterium]MDR7536133.1 DNA-3-methyladenine glycosylase [Armatimonadota bacterium]
MSRYRPLPRRFFARDAVAVARALVGCLLVHETPRGRLVGRIVETEAYRGPDDPASHAYRKTARSAIMYGPPGRAYVYFTYGMHWCLNVVTGARGVPGAVLLRAVEPVAGVALMRRLRGAGPDVPAARLAAGPGRLTRALGVGPRHNGRDLTRPPLYLAAGAPRRKTVLVGPRVGITAARRRRWRFGLAGSPALSRPFPRRL